MMTSKSLIVWCRLFCALSLVPTVYVWADEGTPHAALALDQVERDFAETIYPLLQRGGEESCVSCHDAATSSELEFIGDVRDDFRMLVAGKYFNSSQPDSLVARIEATNSKRRMPKGDKAPQWSPDEIQRLKSFSTRVRHITATGTASDEGFPFALLEPFRGAKPDDPDTQFISFTQLKGKIRTLFDDEWVRDGVDRFAENVALFGGADFETRFNESTQASSGFMSALRDLARDVAERAYVTRSGPFAQSEFWTLAESDPEAATRFLYRHVLHRDPRPGELVEGEGLRAMIREAQESIRSRAHQLTFSIEAFDTGTGRRTSERIRIPIRTSSSPVYQERLDQSLQASGAGTSKLTLSQPVTLRAGEEGQGLFLRGPKGSKRMSFVGVLMEHEAGKTVEWIDVQDPRIELEGAWKLTQRKGYWSAESEGDEGSDKVFVPLQPDFDGPYRLTVHWRANRELTTRAVVEVRHGGTSSVLVDTMIGPQREGNMVRFAFDGTVDTEPHVDFEPWFRFGDRGYVEINNTGTRGKVAVGPLGFLSADGREYEIDTKEADGFKEWAPFKAVSFNAYNQRGTRVEDQNKRKGDLYLRYDPRTRNPEGFQAGDFHRVRVYYPGKRDHDPDTPVLVYSEASSPIIKLTHPLNAGRGDRVRLDASETFTTHDGTLEIRWKQLGGVPVGALASGPRVEFKVPDVDLDYEYWVALTQALIRHPDFLFTRSPALTWVTDREQKRRLLLSRVALDLVGRSPTGAEFSTFLQDWDWERVVDHYLGSQDFRRFYQHRIRLYLESQGTPEQDEPVRLWCYVAFNDLPFQQILTGDYTVDVDMKRQTRPVFHGKTGVLTTPGFIAGKPGLPHYNYAAQVSMLFLGYRYEVPAEIVEQREGVTALGTTDPNSACYSCHKILTPLAFQRNFWSDTGQYRTHDEFGLPIEASDQEMVAEYPFKGEGLEAFAMQAVKKERFVRTMIDTHFSFLFGRSMRYRTDERALYKTVWDAVHTDGFTIKGLLKTLVLSQTYREGMGLD